MFYYISGKLACLDAGFAVIDAGGVGYRMTVSQTTVSQLPPFRSVDEKPIVKLYSHMAVREDGVELFGFATEEEMEAFRLLIGVSGIGPKAAISILSLLTPQKLAIAICNDDKKTIAKANGIGPKTAARVVLELKDKYRGISIETDDGDVILSDDLITDSGSDAMKDARDALTVLGYSKSEAEGVLRKMKLDGMSVDEIIREALKRLMK